MRSYLQLRTFSRIRMRVSTPRESKCCNTTGRTVRTTWGDYVEKTPTHILSLVFLCINDLAPSYLQELLVQYCPSRNLRSQSKSLLASPRINTQFYGTRSFQSSAPELWNNIPDKIKTSKTIDQFKAALKTHYFMLNN